MKKYLNIIFNCNKVFTANSMLFLKEHDLFLNKSKIYGELAGEIVSRK